ncbi:TetR family transcriptional regulator [Cohnella sp. CFH 77786]|uniref:TetR/AcrR family transcriptional regulator n=1 Tax=Cohnella sp. CFH 77786 TaxID=2662265 RepID=UPI001C60844A|nr:TetR/AcrR family transcriptional regulator [Cohnella sp. CFH 77786]MBW5448910.1 TetR family transcriptional regulator [Cohnella sp. CFH 77786]
MRKSEKTRRLIIAKSAELFNAKGYAGSSIQDVMDVTGLSKGAIYRTFAGKDDIAVEAFAYAGDLLMERFQEAADKATSAIDKVIAVCEVHRDPVGDPPLEGGCPLLNTAVEADDGYAALREPALAAFDRFVALVRSILDKGVQDGELRSDMETEPIASFVVTSLEGGVMASRLTRDNKHVQFAIRQIGLMLSAYKR